MQIIQSDLLSASAFKRHKFSQPEFTSLADAITFADGQPSAGWETPANSVASRETGDTREKWTGTASWQAAKDLAASGWDEGREKIAANLAAIFASGAAELTCGAAVEHAVGGAYPDVPLYVAGNVCHMVSEGDQLDSKPIIKLLINVSASASTSRERIANRGAAVAALVDEIESAGNSCEVHAVDVATQSGEWQKFFLPCYPAEKIKRGN